MKQDEKQSKTQTSNTIVEHEPAACDSEETKREHGDPSDAGSTSSEGGDNNSSDLTDTENTPPGEGDDSSSGSADAKGVSSKEGDGDAKERGLWELVTWLMFMAIAVAIILAMRNLIVGVNALIAAASCMVLFIIFFVIIRLFYRDGEIASKHRIKHRKSAIAFLLLLFVGGEIALAYATFELDARAFMIILLYSLTVAPASGGVLFCWEIKEAKDARERAMGMATVASVAGILLTLLVALM